MDKIKTIDTTKRCPGCGKHVDTFGAVAMYVDKSKLAAGDPEPVYVYMICQECNKINKCAPKHRIERQAAESEKRLADDYSIYAAVKCNGLNAATEIVNDTLTARGGLKIPKILVDEFDDNDRIPK